MKKPGSENDTDLQKAKSVFSFIFMLLVQNYCTEKEGSVKKCISWFECSHQMIVLDELPIIDTSLLLFIYESGFESYKWTVLSSRGTRQPNLELRYASDWCLMSSLIYVQITRNHSWKLLRNKSRIRNDLFWYICVFMLVCIFACVDSSCFYLKL